MERRKPATSTSTTSRITAKRTSLNWVGSTASKLPSGAYPDVAILSFKCAFTFASKGSLWLRANQCKISELWYVFYALNSYPGKEMYFATSIQWWYAVSAFRIRSVVWVLRDATSFSDWVIVVLATIVAHLSEICVHFSSLNFGRSLLKTAVASSYFSLSFFAIIKKKGLELYEA